MPYTPPAQRSPASSNLNSPKLTRSSTSDGETTGSSAPAGPRPAVARSLSSTSYLQRHRRSPSISKATPQPPQLVTNHIRSAIGNFGRASNGSASATPDSNTGSDEDDSAQLLALHDAVHSIPQKRDSSPNSQAQEAGSETPSTDGTAPSRPALTAEARKISHSRSSSEITLSQIQPNLSDTSIQVTDESEEDDEALHMKPPLLRKKSGELVKPALRPATRRRPSSMPGTPTYSKAVHFREDMEQVKTFGQLDRPIAVSANTSPVDNYDSESEYPFGFDGRGSSRPEWELKLINFPRNTYERRSSEVWVEKISMASDNRTMIGTVAVANLAFHKAVVARFTLDYWKTVSEVTAEFNDSTRTVEQRDGYDRFTFSVALADQAHLDTKTLQLCVRYCVNGSTFWDNNSDMNFRVDFVNKHKSQMNAAARRRLLAKGPLDQAANVVRRSPVPASVPRPHSMPDFTATHGARFDFEAARTFLEDAPMTIRLKKAPKPEQPSPATGQDRISPVNQAFSSRYDFGASLTAALSNAQATLGDRSGIKLKASPPAKDETRSDADQQTQGLSTATPPSTLTSTPTSGAGPGLSSEKPDLQSAEYNELIQKYCFYDPGKTIRRPAAAAPNAPANTPSAPTPNVVAKEPQPVVPTPSTVGAAQSRARPASRPIKKEAENAPTERARPRDLSKLADGSADSRSPPTSPILLITRSPSPGSALSSPSLGPRATSPTSFHYPYQQSLSPGLFPHDSPTPTPTAILG